MDGMLHNVPAVLLPHVSSNQTAPRVAGECAWPKRHEETGRRSRAREAPTTGQSWADGGRPFSVNRQPCVRMSQLYDKPPPRNASFTESSALSHGGVGEHFTSRTYPSRDADDSDPELEPTS